MRTIITLALLIIYGISYGQKPMSIFDGRSWGVVLETPEMKNVKVKSNVTYLSDSKGVLKMDIYLPPDLKSTERRPAVVFLNAIGDSPNEVKVKDWGTYSSWPKLVAANGYIGISMECDGERVAESVKGVFSFIDKEGSAYGIDASRLGVYAASANVTETVKYLMNREAYSGIKAAVLYYGREPQGPFRKDLPVLFVVSEGDVRGGYTTLWNEVLKNNAPWTIKMASSLIHGFDTFNDNDDSRKIIKETISFWKNNLDVIPPHSWPNSIGRATLAAQYGGDNAKAASLLKQWINNHPDDSRALWQYGDQLRRLKKYDEAEQSLKKAVSLDADNIYAKTDLIVVLFANNRTVEAEKYLSEAQKSGKMNRNTYANIGYALYEANNHKEGIKYFEQTIALGPMSFDYYNLACGYAILNEKDKAFAALEKAVAMGYNSKQQYENDQDLNSLRADKRYQDLLTKLN